MFTAPSDVLADLGARGHHMNTGPLANHAYSPNLHLLNLLYDATPPKYIRTVITELGSISPTSVPVVHRLISEREGTINST